MARIEGIDLPRTKRIEVALTYIYGIGKSHARAVLTSAGVDSDTKVKDLTEAEVIALRDCISNDYRVEGDLRSQVQLNIKRLTEIGCIVESAIESIFLCGDSAHAQTLVLVRVRKRP